MNRIVLVSALLALASLPVVAHAHGTCSHESHHRYGIPGTGPSKTMTSPVGQVTVWDSETGDCDGDGIPLDFDGDYDVGIGGGAFGHGAWATFCGLHVETAGSVTVTDFAFGQTVAFALGADDVNGGPSRLFPCLTDGVINPADPDDCLSPLGVGAQPITCPGGGDGLLWVFLAPAGFGTPATMGTITSP